jgi:hypothetical protein
MYSAAPLDSPNMEPIRSILAHLVNTPIPTQHLLTPPVNVLRIALHPDGMAKRIRNFDETVTMQGRVTRDILAFIESVFETGDYAMGSTSMTA